MADSLNYGQLERILDYQLAEGIQTAKPDRNCRFRTRCIVREHPVYAFVGCVGRLGVAACALRAGIGDLASFGVLGSRHLGIAEYFHECART